MPLMEYPYEASVGVNAKFPLSPNVRYHKVEKTTMCRTDTDSVCGITLVSRRRFKPVICKDTMATHYFEKRRNNCRKCFPSG